MQDNLIKSFDYIVSVPIEKRLDYLDILQWLRENYGHSTYEELYMHYSIADGRWRTGPESALWAVVFENEEDATAFKLRWI